MPTRPPTSPSQGPFGPSSGPGAAATPSVIGSIFGGRRILLATLAAVISATACCCGDGCGSGCCGCGGCGGGAEDTAGDTGEAAEEEESDNLDCLEAKAAAYEHSADFAEDMRYYETRYVEDCQKPGMVWTCVDELATVTGDANLGWVKTEAKRRSEGADAATPLEAFEEEAVEATKQAIATYLEDFDEDDYILTRDATPLLKSINIHLTFNHPTLARPWANAKDSYDEAHAAATHWSDLVHSGECDSMVLSDNLEDRRFLR